MTLREIKDQVAFEAGIADTDTLDTYLTSIIKQTLDDYTSQVRYDELLVPDAEIALASGVGDVELPDGVQHIDLDHIYFQTDGDASSGFRLYSRMSPLGPNEGRVRFVIQQSGATPRLRIWPFAEITSADVLILNYWKKGSAVLVDDSSTLVPSQLTTTVLHDAIARAAIQTDSSKVSIYRTLGKESHGRSFGSTRT